MIVCFKVIWVVTPIIFSKSTLVFWRSVSAMIICALAPAKDDSDWAKSVKVISPFCNLALSDSTRRSNKETLFSLNFLFCDFKIKSKYTFEVSKIVFCSTSLSSRNDFSTSSLDFFNKLYPWKPWNIFALHLLIFFQY